MDESAVSSIRARSSVWGLDESVSKEPERSPFMGVSAGEGDRIGRIASLPSFLVGEVWDAAAPFFRRMECASCDQDRAKADCPNDADPSLSHMIHEGLAGLVF